MRIAQQTATKGRSARAEQMILFRIGGQLFATSASAVQEIRSTDNIAGAAKNIQQPELRKVLQVVRRGQRTLYVVHGGIHFGLPTSPAMLVFLFRNCRAALLVDAIERMATITRMHAVPRAFCREERHWYRGLLAVENTVVPVINPHGLLLLNELALLDATVERVAPEIQDKKGRMQDSA